MRSQNRQRNWWCGPLWANGNDFGAENLCRFVPPCLLNWPFFFLHRKIALLTGIFERRIEHIEFPAKLLHYFLKTNKINMPVNQLRSQVLGPFQTAGSKGNLQ